MVALESLSRIWEVGRPQLDGFWEARLVRTEAARADYVAFCAAAKQDLPKVVSQEHQPRYDI